MRDKGLTNAIDAFGLCLARLAESVQTPAEDNRELAGVVKHFEMAFEQAYKCLIELLLEMGEEDSRVSVKTVFRRAFEFGWIKDEHTFLAMIPDRNESSHTYNAGFAKDMIIRIREMYLPAFRDLEEKLRLESARLANE